jgi:hypothetical protein
MEAKHTNVTMPQMSSHQLERRTSNLGLMRVSFSVVDMSPKQPVSYFMVVM